MLKSLFVVDFSESGQVTLNVFKDLTPQDFTCKLIDYIFKYTESKSITTPSGSGIGSFEVLMLELMLGNGGRGGQFSSVTFNLYLPLPLTLGVAIAQVAGEKCCFFSFFHFSV